MRRPKYPSFFFQHYSNQAHFRNDCMLILFRERRASQTKQISRSSSDMPNFRQHIDISLRGGRLPTVIRQEMSIFNGVGNPFFYYESPWIGRSTIYQLSHSDRKYPAKCRYHKDDITSRACLCRPSRYYLTLFGQAVKRFIETRLL